MISVYCDNDLIGFGRIISDGKLHAFIVELIVSSSYRGNGIGSRILELLVNQAKSCNINDIQLFCAKDKKQFYLKNNFVARPDDAPGMQYKI